MNPNKFNELCGKVLKEMQDHLSHIITLIFQKSINTHIIPTDGQHGNVCSAFKKGDKINAINYRPISLTCILCKIMEHIIASQIMEHLETNNNYMIYKMVFDQTCDTILLSFIQDLAKDCNYNIQTDVIVTQITTGFRFIGTIRKPD